VAFVWHFVALAGDAVAVNSYIWSADTIPAGDLAGRATAIRSSPAAP
jgi:hypothetical protein